MPDAPRKASSNQPDNHSQVNIPAQFNIAEHFLARLAAEHPGRIAILGEPAPVSYRDLANLANRVAAALLQEKVLPGERVLIVLPDSAEFVAAFFGVARIGAIAVPVNPMARQSDYAHFLRDSGARLAIVYGEAMPEFLPAAKDFPPRSIVVVGGEKQSPPGCKIWREWLPKLPINAPLHKTRATDPAFFLYTSGSGGSPKAAVHLHKDMLVTSQSYALGVLAIRPDDR